MTFFTMGRLLSFIYPTQDVCLALSQPLTAASTSQAVIPERVPARRSEQRRASKAA